MFLRNLLKPEYFIVRLIIAIALVYVFLFALENLPILKGKDEINQNFSQIKANEVATPTKLRIPVLGLEANIVGVGKTQDGNMDVPQNLVDVGWYNLGPRPGEKGNAVIAGHEVDSLGFGVVFKNLKKIKKGDLIIVEMNSEQKKVFEVRDIQIYDYDRAPAEVIFGPSDKSNLNLITCVGDFVTRLNTKNKRLVVYTTAI